MFQFEAIFTRYKDNHRRQSGVMFIMAENFARAVEQANAYLLGAREADPEADFEIASITHTGLQGPEAIIGWKLVEELGQ